MKIRLSILLVILCSTLFSFAQKKTYADSLSKALNAIVTTLPDACKSLYGELNDGSQSSYKSKVNLPRSVHNRFDIDTAAFASYPFVFMSYIPLGNDKPKAIAQLKKMGKAIESTSVLYNGKNYKIQFLVKESKNGDSPDYQYNLIDPPAELSEVKFYLRLDDNFGVKTKYKSTMGVYIKKNY